MIGDSEEPLVRALASRWLAERPVSAIESLTVPGAFSGARIWRIVAGDAAYALRRWPSTNPGRARIEAVHRFLRHVGQRGVQFTPQPVSTMHGGTTWEQAGALWHLETWRPGEPDLSEPSDEPLRQAAAALAQLHLAAATGAPLDEQGRGARNGTSPTLAERAALAERLLRGELSEIATAGWPAAAPQQREAALVALGQVRRLLPEVVRQLHPWLRRELPLAWRHGDPRREHFLYAAGQVAGLVDFGAASVDALAADTARLLESWCGADRERWHVGQAAYEAVRPLESAEQDSLEPLRTSGLVLAAARWLRWLGPASGRFSGAAAQPGWRRLGRLTERLAALPTQF